MASIGQKLLENYKKFISDNPDKATSLESALRIFSYIYPGANPAVSELLYSAGNLLTLLNDAILRQSRNIAISVPLCSKTLSMWLSVLETLEVFLEIAAQNWGSDPVRWLMVVCVQLAKAAIRFVLLYKNKSGVQISPYIPQLNRKKDLAANPQTTEEPITSTDSTDNNASTTFSLKSSGRTIRSLSATPPLSSREWRVPQPGGSSGDPQCTAEMTAQQQLGESLHILRPLIHLFSMYTCGLSSWRPWLIAGGVDASSVCLLSQGPPRPSDEAAEVQRRRLMLLLYLLRSPFYDQYTKERLVSTLVTLRGTIPLSRLILNPLLEYLPYWQKVYSYNWMS